MKYFFTVIGALCLFSIAAHAASIWSASDGAPAVGTERVPVDTGPSGTPTYLEIDDFTVRMQATTDVGELLNVDDSGIANAQVLVYNASSSNYQAGTVLTGIGVEEEGSSLGSFSILDFVGSGVTATNTGGGQATVTVSAVVPSGAQTESMILGPSDCVTAPTAIGSGDIAIGCGASTSLIVSEGDNLAIGRNSHASGNNSLAWGLGANASGINALAFGDTANATGQKSVAVGQESDATADFAVALGNFAQATAENAYAMGDQATAGFMNSYAMGADVTTNTTGQMKLHATTGYITLGAIATGSLPAGAPQGSIAYDSTLDTIVIDDNVSFQPVYTESYTVPYEVCATLTTMTGALDATGTSLAMIPLGTAKSLVDVFARANTATTTGVLTFDMNYDDGTPATMLSTKLTIDATERTGGSSGTQGAAATAAVITTTSLAAADAILIDVDGIGDGTATGVLVCAVLKDN